MRLSNFEQTKLDYYNRKLGNVGSREFDYFSLDETMAMYKRDAELLSYLPAGDPAEMRFLSSVTLLKNYHEFLHKKHRLDDSEMVYCLTGTSHPQWRERKEVFTGYAQAMADLYALRVVFVPNLRLRCHLWPTPLAERSVIEAFFKEEGVSFELVSPPMALALEQSAELGIML